jgi:alpha-aminoadipate carrier protein LysW
MEVKGLKADCPSCEAHVLIPDDFVNGEIVSCPDCGAEYEVTMKSKGDIELKPAEMEGEDWGE